MARTENVSSRESSGNKTIQSSDVSRIGGSSRSSECIEGSSNEQGSKDQSFEDAQCQGIIRCQSRTATQAATGSRDSFTSVAEMPAATFTNCNGAESFMNGEREDSIGVSPQTGGPATAGISDAVRIIGGSDDIRAACTVGRARSIIPMDLLNTIINNIVDDVTFFESWIGLTTEDDSADGLRQSVWQRVKIQWRKAQRGTVEETESELSFTEEFNKKVGLQIPRSVTTFC